MGKMCVCLDQADGGSSFASSGSHQMCENPDGVKHFGEAKLDKFFWRDKIFPSPIRVNAPGNRRRGKR